LGYDYHVDEILLKKLYIREKKSSAEVAGLFNCSQHKINYWLEKYKIPKRSISEAIYNKCNPQGDPFKPQPVLNVNDAKLFGLGLGLYWGEGNKKNKNSVRLGNSNPLIIKNFIKFLIRIFKIKKEKLRFGLQIFGDLSERKVLNFWLKELREFCINKSQFFKVTITPTRSLGNYREKSKWGVLTVHFANTKLKNLIDSMLPL
jgi:hypothetical protein